METSQTQVAVVGGGIAGLTLAFSLQRSGVDVHVLEARDRAGGNIRSEARDGYVCEWGPNGWLDNEPATARLVDALGLQDQVVQASENANRRWIVRDGALRELPSRPPQLLTSDLLSLRGKLRVLMEWAQPARRDATDESTFDFAARRIGREAAEVLVDAMVTGIYAGDARNLSLTSAFPRMRDMEQRHGGLFKAMHALRRERRKQGGKRAAGSPMGPGGTLTSFAYGLETLVRRLTDTLGERLHLSLGVDGLSAPTNGRWTLKLANGASLEAERVVLANPAWKAAEILRTLDVGLADVVGRIPSAPVAVVCFGFRREDVRHLQAGFGFLVPGREELPILGTLFDTWVFPNRSPEDRVLFRTMIGGAREPEALEETDAQLQDRALSTLSRLLGLRANPEMGFVVRHLRGIPQYPVGHPATLQRIDVAVARYPGLWLTGNSYRGIAMNSCIKEAEALATRLVEECNQPKSSQPSA